MIKTVNSILIVGGGTAGWMAAAAISHRYRDDNVRIQLVESEEICGVGVGEATVPGIRQLHYQLGISEREFICATKATFKLGIEFRDWLRKDHKFFHPFAAYGLPIAEQDFYQCWLKLYHEGHRFNLEEFSLAIGMARAGRFAQPDENADTLLAWYNYAYHFDASLYAAFLRRYAEERGVVRIEGKIVAANRSIEDGGVANVQLENGQLLEADLYVDCSGFRALLIEQCLETGFEDWSYWLPCDSAIAVQTESGDDPLPYTTSTALEEGWQWRIPLQHRKGNGYVYCSKYIDPEAAQQKLLANLDGEPLTEPRLIRFNTGIRKDFWNGNCVALGLASGFIEPLESTSISLIQTGIYKLLQYMPDLKLDPKNIAEANLMNRLEYERIRDFIVLHYKSSTRTDSGFWRQIQDMEMPESLAEKIALFAEDGTVLLHERETFDTPSWLAMYNGFQLVPKQCKSEVRGLDSGQLETVFGKIRGAISKGVEHAPRHADFLKDLY